MAAVGATATAPVAEPVKRPPVPLVELRYEDLSYEVPVSTAVRVCDEERERRLGRPAPV